MKIGINLHPEFYLVRLRSYNGIKYIVLLVVLMLGFSLKSFSKNYYFSSSTGNDSYTANQVQNPNTPWKSIDKLNKSMNLFAPGDFILFKRGDTFYGTIVMAKSGIPGNPVVLGAYGTGNDPIITGFTTITGWTNEGGGIYSKIITSAAQTNVVTIDEIQYGMGRYPDATYLTYESFSGYKSITDYGLGDATNWAGAEVVIRKSDFVLDRCIITNHTGDVLTYTTVDHATHASGTNNFGYFIQNDLRCITAFGEWYHNPSTDKFYMYFGEVNPTTKTVKVVTLNSLFINEGYDYITIDNISFIGSIKTNVALGAYTGVNSDNCTIKNCTIDFSGYEGILIPSGSDYCKVENNSINHSGRAGVFAIGSANTGTTITNNTINASGIIEGIADRGTWNVGIYLEQNNGLVQYNTINSSGYNGIYFQGNGLEIKNNFINNSLLLLADGGGIYTSGDFTGRIIDGNIVLNTIGNLSGTTHTNSSTGGIYLDEYSENVTVKNNTVANCVYGFLLHKANTNTLENNTSFDCTYNMWFNNSVGSSTIFGNTMNENIFFAKEKTQYAIGFRSEINDISRFGTADHNYYIRPIDDGYTFHLYQPSLGGYIDKTLAEWQKFTSQDANSHKSPTTVTNINDIRFEYNATKTNKIITLYQPMIDVKGIKHADNITLLPFTSVVLMVDHNAAQTVIPLYSGSAVENAAPSVIEIIYNIALANIVPAISAFSVRVNSVDRTVNSVAISGTKVILTLSSVIVFGDLLTVAYTKPSSNPLQASAGGQAASMTAQTVTNKVNAVTAIILNTPPVIVVNSTTESFSGFVGELDATKSYDANNDKLLFTWTIPENIPVTSTNSSNIEFLSPAVSRAQTFEFVLQISDGKTTQTKSVPVVILPYKQELETAEILSINASEFEPPYSPYNILDGDIGTKWSANGDDQWIIMELKELFNVHHVKIVFQPGQKQTNYFDVLGSEDNSTWEPILSKSASCGFSGELQVFDFPPSKASVEYKFIKLVGHSNSGDSWNHISEFRLFGYKHKNPTSYKDQPVKLYPNPVCERLNIRIDDPSLKPNFIKILNLSGNIVYEDLMNPEIKDLSIPITFGRGIYIVQIGSGDLTLFTQKLVVKC